MADAQKLDDRGEIASGRAGLAVEPAPVEQVAAHAEMREQPAVLEDIADAAAMPRNEDAALGVDQHLAVDGDAAAVRPHQAADDVDQGRLARARPAEQRRQPGRGREARVDPKAAAQVIDVDFQAHAAIRWTPMRRASSSEPSSASIEIAIETSVSRIAPASPPGTWVKV